MATNPQVIRAWMEGKKRKGKYIRSDTENRLWSTHKSGDEKVMAIRVGHLVFSIETYHERGHSRNRREMMRKILTTHQDEWNIIHVGRSIGRPILFVDDALESLVKSIGSNYAHRLRRFDHERKNVVQQAQGIQSAISAFEDEYESLIPPAVRDLIEKKKTSIQEALKERGLHLEALVGV